MLRPLSSLVTLQNRKRRKHPPPGGRITELWPRPAAGRDRTKERERPPGPQPWKHKQVLLNKDARPQRLHTVFIEHSGKATRAVPESRWPQGFGAKGGVARVGSSRDLLHGLGAVRGRPPGLGAPPSATKCVVRGGRRGGRRAAAWLSGQGGEFLSLKMVGPAICFWLILFFS